MLTREFLAEPSSSYNTLNDCPTCWHSSFRARMNSSTKSFPGSPRSKKATQPMSRRTVLPFARPTTLQAVLDGIVARTNAKPGHDLRQVTTLKPVVAAEADLPVFAAAPPDGQVGFVYCAGQCPHVPPGEPPLIVYFRPLPGYGCEQDGVFSGAIVVYAWQHPEYPLSPKEVEWSIAHDCGCEDHEWCQLALCWENFNAIVHDDLQDLAAQYGAASDTSEIAQERYQPAGRHKAQAPPRIRQQEAKRRRPPSHRGSGQPRNPATFHLMNLMRTCRRTGSMVPTPSSRTGCTCMRKKKDGRRRTRRSLSPDCSVMRRAYL